MNYTLDKKAFIAALAGKASQAASKLVANKNVGKAVKTVVENPGKSGLAVGAVAGATFKGKEKQASLVEELNTIALQKAASESGNKILLRIAGK